MSACSWPEQDAVDAWLKKNEVEIAHPQSLELKEAVSEYRIQMQRKYRMQIAKYESAIRALECHYPNENLKMPDLHIDSVEDCDECDICKLKAVVRDANAEAGS